MKDISDSLHMIELGMTILQIIEAGYKISVIDEEGDLMLKKSINICSIKKQINSVEECTLRVWRNTGIKRNGKFKHEHIGSIYVSEEEIVDYSANIECYICIGNSY